MNFSFRCPTRLEFGPGLVRRAGELLSGLGLDSALLVCGSGPTKASPGYAALKDSLRAAGVAYGEFARVTPDPSDALVNQAAAQALAEGRSCVLAYGGGSPIDCAKSAALVAANAADGRGADGRGADGSGADGSGAPGILDYLYGRAQPVRPALPIIAVPTTAGTGSEMSAAAVTTDAAAKRKLGYSHDSFFPAVALVDPELHLSMPPSVTAATGMDALTHVIESYLSLGANPASDAVNLRCAELIGGSLKRAYERGDDLDARADMAAASALAGAAFSNTGLGMVHGFAHPVGARHGVAHGSANAVILPFVLAAMEGAAGPRMRRLAEALAPGMARAGLPRLVAELAAALGIAPSLKALGIAEPELAAILPDALSYRMRPRSPRAFSDAELEALLRAAWEGDLKAAAAV